MAIKIYFTTCSTGAAKTKAVSFLLNFGPNGSVGLHYNHFLGNDTNFSAQMEYALSQNFELPAL